jgi:hypothetical protein
VPRVLVVPFRRMTRVSRAVPAIRDPSRGAAEVSPVATMSMIGSSVTAMPGIAVAARRTLVPAPILLPTMSRMTGVAVGPCRAGMVGTAAWNFVPTMILVPAPILVPAMSRMTGIAVGPRMAGTFGTAAWNLVSAMILVAGVTGTRWALTGGFRHVRAVVRAVSCRRRTLRRPLGRRSDLGVLRVPGLRWCVLWSVEVGRVVRRTTTAGIAIRHGSSRCISRIIRRCR